jgi:WD40 repeat protein
VITFEPRRCLRKNSSLLRTLFLVLRVLSFQIIFLISSASLPAGFARQTTGPNSVSKPELVLQTGSTGPAQSVAFSDDGRLLASGGTGGLSIQVWETGTGRQLRTLVERGGRSGMLFAGITALALSHDGRLLAGGFADNSMTIWDLDSGEALASLAGTGTTMGSWLGVLAIEFSPDGKYLLTQHSEGLKVWDLSTGSKVREIQANATGSSCNSATFSADGRQIIAIGAGSGPALIVRNAAQAEIALTSTEIATGKQTPIIELSGELPAMSRGKCVVKSADGHILVSTATEDTEQVWELGSGNGPRVLFNPISNKQDFYPSLQVISAAGKFAAFAQHAKLYVWDLAGAVQIYSTGIEADPERFMANEIASLEFSSTGEHLAVGTYDGRIRIFESASGRLQRTLEGHINVSASVVFDRQDRKLLSGQKTAWNLDYGLGERILPQAGNGAGIFSGDGEWLAEPSQKTGDVLVWNVDKQELTSTLPSKSDALVDQIAFSPDKKIVAIAYARNTARQQPPATPSTVTPAASLGTLRPPMKSGKRKNGATPENLAQMIDMIRARQQAAMANLADTGGQITFWNVLTGSEIGSLVSVISPSVSRGNLTFSPDGHSLAVATDAGIEIWDVTTHLKKTTLEPPAAPPPTHSTGLFGAMNRNGRQIQSLRYSPDGRFLAVALKDSSKSRAELSAAMDDNFTSITHRRQSGIHFPLLNQVSPTGAGPQKNKSAASVPGSNMPFNILGPIEVWDTTNGQRILDLPGHPNGAGLVAFSPNGKLLATTGTEDDIKLWELPTGKELRTLSGHTAVIQGLAFDSKSNLLASASGDGTTRLWDPESGEQLATLLSLNDGRDWLVITPDGLFDGSPLAWNEILWRFQGNLFDVAPVEVFFNDFYYPDLLADIVSGKRPHPKQDVALTDRRQPQLSLASVASQNGPVAAMQVPVQIHISAAPAGAQDIRLFRNGSLVKIWHGDVMGSRDQATLEATVPIVAGRNRLSAYAFNNGNIKSADVVLDITGAESLRRVPVAHILAVGIDTYSNNDYNLQYAGADALDFTAELKKQMEQQRRFAEFDVKVLKDQEATKANILAAIEDMAKRVRPEDEVFIFVASHGTAARDHFFMIPYDLGYQGNRSPITEQGVNTILEHSISDQDLENSFAQLDADRILLVIDACNSGQALIAEEKRRGPMNTKGLAQLAYEKGMYILTASQSYQAAQEVSRLGHGLLTYALVVEGLQKSMADFEPHDGKIVVREWLDYATGRVPKLQLEEVEKAQIQGRSLSFGESLQPRTLRPDSPKWDGTQRPKLFYRREVDGTPWVVSAPE